MTDDQVKEIRAALSVVIDALIKLREAIAVTPALPDDDEGDTFSDPGY